MFFRSRRGSTAVAEPGTEALFAEIEELSERNRALRDAGLERRIRALRHEAGAILAGSDAGDPDFPAPAYDQLTGDSGIPEVTADELTPELLRAGILGRGAVLVRGVMDRERATGFAAEIETALQARTSLAGGGGAVEGYYEEFDPGPPVDLAMAREWIGDGGMWAADSPKLMFEMFEAFERCGLRDVIHGYLNEIPAISIEKCTLRRVMPDSDSAWHQDGAFLGRVRALNVWLSLSRCGDEAPGLDVVPKRLEEIVPTGTEGAIFNWSVSPQLIDGVTSGAGVVRPIFEPGDALLFDEMNLHSTAADPSMPNPRYAIESWFFGLSGFPAEYVPIAY
ncbi:MAG: hypothetical protein QOI10_2089 [Solirubrobacterales bacterium]|jgi:hypothetical protein|nr:hypothetical protein [Solirubrobacterales bacterium]